MSSFKHKYAIAETLAWAAAVKENVADQDVRDKIALASAEYVGALSRGERVDGVTLEDVKSLDFVFQALEDSANAEKQGYPNNG